MKNYIKGFIGGILASVCMLIFVAATNQSDQYSQISENELISKLEEIETKIQFNYNVLNKHLVRIMAYGVKVKDGYIDGVRQPVNCQHITNESKNK